MPLSNYHWTIKYYKQRCLRKEAQEILLEREHINFRGTPVFLKCKSVGAGVYEIYKDFELKGLNKKNKFASNLDSQDNQG